MFQITIFVRILDLFGDKAAQMHQMIGLGTTSDQMSHPDAPNGKFWFHCKSVRAQDRPDAPNGKFRDHFGSFRYHFGVMLGSVWGHLGITLVTARSHLRRVIRDHFGIILGLFWDSFRGHFGQNWGV